MAGIRFEPGTGFHAAGFWARTAPETLTSFGSFLDRGMQFRGSGPDCAEVELVTLLCSG
jgi:hypothetical protein